MCTGTCSYAGLHRYSECLCVYVHRYMFICRASLLLWVLVCVYVQRYMLTWDFIVTLSTCQLCVYMCRGTCSHETSLLLWVLVCICAQVHVDMRLHCYSECLCVYVHRYMLTWDFIVTLSACVYMCTGTCWHETSLLLWVLVCICAQVHVDMRLHCYSECLCVYVHRYMLTWDFIVTLSACVYMCTGTCWHETSLLLWVLVCICAQVHVDMRLHCYSEYLCVYMCTGTCWHETSLLLWVLVCICAQVHVDMRLHCYSEYLCVYMCTGACWHAGFHCVCTQTDFTFI